MQTRDVAKLALEIRAIWGFFDFPESALRIWTKALAEIEPAAATAALEEWCQTESKPPAPADIRRLATRGKTIGLADPAGKPRADLPETVVIFRTLDPATGDYQELAEPRSLSFAEYRELYRDEWAAYRAMHPEDFPRPIVAEPIEGTADHG